ncbi:lysozyme inhibitor LprI family protein [Laspinema olomoucense]|uniref:lysozyme inhibitor LprI family protein n=1 Tax=Laspinema olomoucense TaxID=3231600 RepID=UPI0021BA5E50|nr:MULTISPECIES: lysozyme inhibitor LprI family protein [unclassified Laspinema]MCT7973697.1 lysozyme inhibitor LprI family protein [Laspinema sp. D3d]MCT7996603.1 lysozyme inhibitor LprI family protein [Laspinema sp. D3c]
MKAKLTSLTYLTLGLLATLIIGPILPSLAQNRPNCSSPMTQADMNSCAGQSFRVADAELNRVYNQFINNLSASRRERLIDAQLAWISYRDATCELEGESVRGGSLQPLYITTCKTGLTETRTQEFVAYSQNRYPAGSSSRFSEVEQQHRSALNTLRNRNASSLLDASENAWQAYRSSACEFERSGGGNAAFNNCQIRLTEQRIQQLK